MVKLSGSATGGLWLVGSTGFVVKSCVRVNLDRPCRCSPGEKEGNV
jgi:hypothetical protein